MPDRILHAVEKRVVGRCLFGRGEDNRARRAFGTLFGRPAHRRGAPCGFEVERRLTAAAKFQIDFRQELAIEQRAVQAAHRDIDLETPAQSVQADLRAGKALPGQCQSIDRARRIDPGPVKPRQFGVQEREVELGVVDNEGRITNEFEKLVDDIREFRLTRQKLRRQAVDCPRLLGHAAFRVEVLLELPSGRQAPQHLDATDLDNSVAGSRFKARGFGIKNDLAQEFFGAFDGWGPGSTAKPWFGDSVAGAIAIV